MTCKDCKYYNGTVQATHSEYYICMQPKYKGLDSWCWVSSKVEKCKDYEPTHESVGNALDALNSWESISK